MGQWNEYVAKCAILALAMMVQIDCAYAQEEMPSGPLVLHGAVQPNILAKRPSARRSPQRGGQKPARKSAAAPAKISQPVLPVISPALPKTLPLVPVVPAQIAERTGKAAEPAEQAKSTKAPATAAATASPPDTKAAQAFCLAIADRAADVRNAWQAQKISELEARLKERIDEFDARRKDYQQWAARQDEARRKAEDGVVAIFAKMRPDAAASQLSAMDDAVAAAVLAKLSARTASVILNEITPAKAARIADAISGGARDMK